MVLEFAALPVVEGGAVVVPLVVDAAVAPDALGGWADCS
jgi:hypothetical protein